jgi:ribosomal protein S18 acetylase RimI-like enzyme
MIEQQQNAATSVTIYSVSHADASRFADAIGQIHKSAYSKRHFTSTFSRKKLAEYNEGLIANSDISLVAQLHDRTVGFAIAGRHVSKGVKEFTQQNRAYLIGRLVRHPRFMVAKVIAFLRSKMSKPTPSSAKSRLLSIATDPVVQSRGVGAKLLEELENLLRESGEGSYGLSVRKNNDRAVAFYVAHGFVVEKAYLGSIYLSKNIRRDDAKTRVG